MKRFISLLLTCLFLLPLCACAPAPAQSGTENGAETQPETITLFSSQPGETRILKPNTTGGLVSCFTGVEVNVTGSEHTWLEQVLSEAKRIEGAEEKPKTHTTFDPNKIEVGMGGCFWLYTESGLYRGGTVGGKRRISAVKNEYAGGDLLELDEKTVDRIFAIKDYFPHDAWEAVIRGRTTDAKQVYNGPADAEFRIRSIQYEKSNHLCTVKAEVTAKRDVSGRICLDRQYPGCVQFSPEGSAPTQELSLKEGETETVTLSVRCSEMESLVLSLGNTYWYLSYPSPYPLP